MRDVRHSRQAVFGLVLALGACWPADPAPGPATEAAVESREESAEAAPAAVETMAERPLTLDEPLTLRLEPRGELLEAIRGLPAEGVDQTTLRLTLVDLEQPESEFKVRAFVNHPGASADTPVDDPHFVGEVGFYPATASAAGPETPPDSTFLLDLGPVLAELPPGERLADGRFLDVTLVALPLREGAATEAAAEILVGGVRLSLHRPG